MPKPVTWDEYHEAYRVWRELSGHAINMNSELKFDTFLVGEYIRASGSVLLGLTHEKAPRLQWLLGPNAKTLYKAWKAQNDTTS